MRRLLPLALSTLLGGCMPSHKVASTPLAPQPSPPAGMQYLYGSGEAAALSWQAYNALVDNVRARLAEKGERTSVILEDGATLDQPRFIRCGDKPLAAVFDMDETSVLNLGYEYNDAVTGAPYDDARWKRFEATGDKTVSAVPGARAAFGALRAMGVTVIVNSNRVSDNAAATERALAFAGLGAFKHGETMFLKGDIDSKSAKDSRRAAIAGRFCVIAMGGDQLGDFSDKFQGLPSGRRALADSAAIGGLWGHGWFVLPNPVYGAGLAGNFDQVFPEDRRWVDPAANGGK